MKKSFLHSKLIYVSLALGLAIALSNCNKNTNKDVLRPVLPSTPFDYTKDLTIHIPNNTPANNKVSNEGATLGRVLFYDKALSINNGVSCGSCHKQEHAFADNVALSIGFDGKPTGRNASAICNVANQAAYFWDGRVTKLEDMVLLPVRHQVEMGIVGSDVLPKKLKELDYYAPLFKAAFGSEEITSTKISLALAQFLRSMSSYKSPLDELNFFENGWWALDRTKITASQNRGANLFVAKRCNNCHSDGFNMRGGAEDFEANIGLEMEYTDKGLGELVASKEGIFKIPSLRNIHLTAPYMHDGRFKDLKEVLDHYSDNIVNHKNLSPILTNSWNSGGQAIKLSLTESEKNDLIEFMKLLTDQSLISDVKFSDPFKR